VEFITFVYDGTEVVKKAVSKGERLGWTPLDKVKSVTLSSMVVTGRRVSVPSSNRLSTESHQRQVPFLIP
jgi:hypothetical protein